jgi:hypothetical protein
MSKKKNNQHQVSTENTIVLLELLNKMGLKHKYETVTLKVDKVFRRVTILTLLEHNSDTDGCPLELYIYNDKFVKDLRCFPLAE